MPVEKSGKCRLGNTSKETWQLSPWKGRGFPGQPETCPIIWAAIKKTSRKSKNDFGKRTISIRMIIWLFTHGML